MPHFRDERGEKPREGRKTVDLITTMSSDPQNVPESLLRIYRMLDAMKTWEEGWNSYDALPPNPLALDKARAWITEFYVFAADPHWIQPNVTASAHGDIVFDWCNGKKDLEIIIDEDGETIWYLKVWGPDVRSEMEDGDIKTIEDAGSAYSWLFI